jgi:hypothetical protein
MRPLPLSGRTGFSFSNADLTLLNVRDADILAFEAASEIELATRLARLATIINN